MSTRACALGFALIVGVCVFTQSAHAQSPCPGCPGVENPADGFSGWDNLEPAGGFNPPTTTNCVAYQSSNQRCRICVEATNLDGSPKGYSVCGSTARDGGCYCENSGTAQCVDKGWCKYNAW
jgi:hypothetical protein